MYEISCFITSVGDPDPQDPHVLPPPLPPPPDLVLPFSRKGAERTEIMLGKIKFLHKILAKNLIFNIEDNVPAGNL
jgi:hypothetical protein